MIIALVIAMVIGVSAAIITKDPDNAVSEVAEEVVEKEIGLPSGSIEEGVQEVEKVIEQP